MRAVAAAALVGGATAASSSSAIPAGYSYTPVGPMRSECVHSVPSGSVVERVLGGGARATLADGTVRAFPPCVSSEGSSLRSSASVGGGRALQLPADYDGWLQYAAVPAPSQDGFGSFLGSFTVPTEPAATPDILYYFTALQSVDWIPKTTPWPNPESSFDIIQPVLQFPADSGSGWSVKSWWVTLDAGAFASQEVLVKPGDVIFGNMTKTGAGQWFIDSVNTATGKRTAVTAKGLGPRLDSQPWAYITMECYGCTSCSTVPAHNGSSAFSGMSITDASGAPFVPTWTANQFPAKDRTCPSSIDLQNATNAVIYSGAP